MLLTTFHKLTFRMIGLIAAIVVACRLTNDYAMVAITLIGVFYALSNQRGKALVFYLIYPFLGFINPLILPRGTHFAVFSRLGTLFMAGALLVAAVRSPGKEKVPLGGLYAFVVCAVISSTQGWFPMISYLKLINFMVFISGIYMGTRNLHHRPSDIILLRATFIALSCIMVYGSLATLPFPAVAYITSLSIYIRESGIAYAEAMMKAGEISNVALFAGITNHSQFLAPMLVCINSWLLCDMLMVEKKIDKMHLTLLLACPVLLFMTRSRVGFFGYVFTGVIIYLVVLPKIQLARRVRGRILWAMVGMGVLIVFAGLAAEYRSQTLSRWLRKTEEVADDQRTLVDAVTASRQSTIELCLYEFRRSPFLGSGFQVIEEHREQYEAGLINLFTAPIEKGILPLMVLGETGVLGVGVFFGFLISFVSRCMQKRYLATLTLFGVLFLTNMGEATFFAPSGGGGILWLLTVVGGFLIDMTMVLERKGAQQQLMRQMGVS